MNADERGNATDESGEIIGWSTAETATTIMAACIPVYRAFCRQLRKKLLAQYRSFNSKQRSAPSTSKNGSGGSTTFDGRKFNPDQWELSFSY